MLRVDPIGQYPNPTSKDFITKWMIDARLLVSKWLNSRSLNHEECHIWAIGSGQSFQGMKDVRPCLGGDWEGWAASCVVFICCNGGEDGHFCGIIIPSLHRAHTQTPYRITFQIENICIIWLIFLTGNWRILPLSPTGAFTYCLDSWLQLSYSSNSHFQIDSREHSIHGGRHNYLQREMSLEIKML